MGRWCTAHPSHLPTLVGLLQKVFLEGGLHLRRSNPGMYKTEGIPPGSVPWPGLGCWVGAGQAQRLARPVGAGWLLPGCLASIHQLKASPIPRL